VPGTRTSAISVLLVDDRDVDGGDRRQVARDLRPRLALVGAREDLAGARAEVDAGDVVRVHRHPLPENAEVRVHLRQPVPQRLPARAGVARAPDGRLAVVHRPAVAAVDRDDVERLGVVRMDGGGEAEVARQSLRDLRPRLSRVVGAVHADMVLLVHPLRVRGADELVDAEADVFVVARPVAPQPLVARRPRGAAVVRLERADTLDDREEVVRVVRVGDEAGDAEVAGRLVRGIVPVLAAVLAGERREKRPRRAVVLALEDAGRLDADEETVAGARERRDLVDLPAVVVGIAQSLARHLPRRAAVAAAPDARAVPLARRSGVDRVGRRVVDRVVDGPALAERLAQRPVLPVVAL